MAARRRPVPLVLFPGSGSSSEHPGLLAVEAAVAPRPVARVDFAYRLSGRRAPDRPPVLLETVRHAIAAQSGPVVAGGRSMGGRIASMVAAEGALPITALVLICYPLHPPGKPERLRVEHFGQLTMPCLFVSGTRDTFGSPAEITAHTAAIRGSVTHVWIEGKGHDLKGADQAVATSVAEWLSGLG
jgi:hypothetical protein